jgi:hypothetical protein
MVEIERSRELGSSQVEGPSVGCPKPRGCEGRERDSRWIWIGEDRWIRTGDRASEPQEKRQDNLAAGIARLREGDIPTAGG